MTALDSSLGSRARRWMPCRRPFPARIPARELLIRKAVPADESRIMALLIEASTWLKVRGSDQWQGSHDRRRELVRRDIDHGTVFVVEDDGDLVATITVDKFADTDFWNRTDDVASAVYVHRMAVARSHAGLEIGAAMLDWAARQATRKGRAKVWLDAWRTNAALHEYYTCLGFNLVRIEDAPHRQSGALFEQASSYQFGALTTLRTVQPPAVVPKAAPWQSIDPRRRARAVSRH